MVTFISKNENEREREKNLLHVVLAKKHMRESKECERRDRTRIFEEGRKKSKAKQNDDEMSETRINNFFEIT